MSDGYPQYSCPQCGRDFKNQTAREHWKKYHNIDITVTFEDFDYE